MMKKAKKIGIAVAVAFIIVGVVLSVGALWSVKFNLSALNAMVNLRPNTEEDSVHGNTGNYITQTYTVEEPFKNIRISGLSTDIRLVPASDEQSRVVITDHQGVTYSVNVENDTLQIIADDDHFGPYVGLYFGQVEMVVYLPEETYESLKIEVADGDVNIPENFTFTEATVNNLSGDVQFAASVENRVCVNTVSGDARLEGVTTKELEVKSTSGTLRLTDVMASGEIQLKTVSGDVNLKQSDAESLAIKTISGDVSASLLTDKTVIPHTISGDIEVPKSNNGGRCEIDTTSGDILVRIEA